MSSLIEVSGPVMIGPSSSHTLGALRIGRFIHHFMEGSPEKVKFYLHQSFSKTYKGHGTDRALLGGIMGFKDDNYQLKMAINIAKEKNIDFEFLEEDLGEVHPNTVKIEAWKGRSFQTVFASSVGAGVIKIVNINGVDCELSGNYPTLIVVNKDTPHALNEVLKLIKNNVANLYLRRINKLLQKALAIIELDEEMKFSDLLPIKALSCIEEVYYISKVVI